MKWVVGVLAALALLTFAGVSTVSAAHDGPDCVAPDVAEGMLTEWQAKVEAEKDGTFIYRLPSGQWLKVTKDKEKTCIVDQGMEAAPTL